MKRIHFTVSSLIIFSGLAAAAEEGIRRFLRSNGQKKIQNRVNKTRPNPEKKDLSVANNHIQLSFPKDDYVDLVHCQETSMSEDEIKEWKAFLSTFVGETTKANLTGITFNGLLECSVPLKDLCRVNGNSEAMRGMVISDGKITKQASFSEAGLGNAAPLFVFQCMAAVTSQYYQQVITERLNAIEKKLDNIIEILEADDRAKLKVAYKRFVELSKKTSYDIADKQIVSEFSGSVETIREKYRELLLGIKDLNIEYYWSDKKEAEQKIQTLQESHYFDYLDMSMQAEALTFIAAAISIKVAMSLGNTEDMKIYADRMNLDFWNNYVDQFNQIKHDVIKYLELEAESSWLQGKSITKMKDEQLEKFNTIEESMLKLQRQFDCRTKQYIQVQKDGGLKKHISVQNV
jgi:hypothetical protein